MTNHVRNTAIEIAKLEIPVFPCFLDKTPANGFGGHHKATSDLEVIPRWIWYDRLIGVPTGTASGISVVDIDRKADGIEWADKHFDRLPDTRVHQTRSGGFHLLFQHVEGLRSSVSKIAPGVDVRAEGGYFIWWPASGGSIVRDIKLTDLPLWPDWLMPPARTKPDFKPPVIPSGSHAQKYVQAAIRNAVQDVLDAPAGTRNQSLNAATFSLTRFLASEMISPDAIALAMTRAGLSVGLSEREVERTVASALSAGSRTYE